MNSGTTTVLIFHPHFTIPGGAGRVALEVGERLSNTYRVVAISQQSNGFHRKSYPGVIFKDTGGPVTSKLGFWLLFPYWYLQYAKIANSYLKMGKTLIFINVFPANWMGFLYKFFHRRIPAFYYCHEPSAFIHFSHWRRAITSMPKRIIVQVLTPLLAVIDRSLTKMPEKVFVNSKYTKQLVEQIYNREATVAYPGITNAYETISKKKNLIISVGRLSKFKRFDMVIKAFSQMKNKDYRLAIVGEGEEKNALIKLASEQGVEGRVDFPGFVSNKQLESYYRQASIFVLASPGEPFGLTPVEAMAAGTPVITDRTGGPAETVINDKTGWTIEMNEGRLSATLDKAVSNKKKLEEMSVQALKHGKTFVWERPTRIIEEWISQQ